MLFRKARALTTLLNYRYILTELYKCLCNQYLYWWLNDFFVKIHCDICPSLMICWTINIKIRYRNSLGPKKIPTEKSLKFSCFIAFTHLYNNKKQANFNPIGVTFRQNYSDTRHLYTTSHTVQYYSIPSSPKIPNSSKTDLILPKPKIWNCSKILLLTWLEFKL